MDTASDYKLLNIKIYKTYNMSLLPFMTPGVKQKQNKETVIC